MTLVGAVVFFACVVVSRLGCLGVPAFRSRPARWAAWSALLLGHAGALAAMGFLVRTAADAAWEVVALALLLAASWSLFHLPWADRALRRALGAPA